MISVHTLESFELFSKHRSNWDEIYRLDPEANYFLSWHWLSQLYQSRDEGVFILAVRMSPDAPGYCAFFPLRREIRFSDSRQRYFNCFSMAGNYWADGTGLICDPEFEKSAIPALANALKTLPWHRVLFESLNMSSRRQALLLESFPQQEYSIKHKSHTDNRGSTDLSRCPTLELPESFEGYLSEKTSTNTRQKIRRIRRKIDSDPHLSIEVTDSQSLEQHLDFFQPTWIENWKKMKGRAAKRLAGKYADFIRLGIESGNMLTPVLLDESRPVGMLACYKDPIKRHLLFFVACRVADFDKIAGGLALHAFCIEWAIENQYTQYHLLRGDEAYKYSLGATDSLLGNIVLFKRNPELSTQLLSTGLKKPALELLGKQIKKNCSTDAVHRLYSQLLDSWPGDTSVLHHYARWLESTGQTGHSHSIHLSLADKHSPTIDNHLVNPGEGTINITPFSNMQQWLDDIENKVQSLSETETLDVKGLKLDITSSDPEYIVWLKSYLYPLVERSAEEIDGCSLVCINANQLVVDIMRLANSGVIDSESLILGRRKIARIHFRSDLVIDINKADGVVYISDNAKQRVTLLLSSRVSWPSLEVSRTARAIIIAYLQQEGWDFLHSGAVRLDNRNYLVIGDEGRGKTSLILALMSAGCQYISNERVFARIRDEKVEALSFPMPVAIGLGTAQQYPELMQFVYNPEQCLYPHRRLNTRKLRSTPESAWATLSDKIQLLGPELVNLYSGKKALQGGCISGVIVPSITKNADPDYPDKADVLDKAALRSVVDRNYIPIKTDTRYPGWLPLAFNKPSTDTSFQLLEAISALPAVQFEYFATRERKNQVAGYPALIERALWQDLS